MSIHDYIIDHSLYDWPSLLQNWAWLLPETLTVWIMNRFGDLFVIVDDGSVHMLDVGCGSFTKIAESRDAFAAMIDDGDNSNQWLMIPLVDELVAKDVTLQPSQCYGFRQPPVLGGQYAIDNVVVLPVQDYYGGYGSIHRQISDLPDGSQVVIQVKNWPQ